MSKSSFYLLFTSVAFFFILKAYRAPLVLMQIIMKTKVPLVNIFKNARCVLKCTISICSK